MSGEQSTSNINQLAIHLCKSQTHTIYKKCSLLWPGGFQRQWKSQDLDCNRPYILIQVHNEAQRPEGSPKLHSCIQKVWNLLWGLYHLSTHPEEVNFVNRAQTMLLLRCSPSPFPLFHTQNLTSGPHCTSSARGSPFSHLMPPPISRFLRTYWRPLRPRKKE